MKNCNIILCFLTLFFLIINVSCDRKNSNGHNTKYDGITTNLKGNKQKNELKYRNTKANKSTYVITNAKEKAVNLSHLRKNTSMFNSYLEMAGSYLTSASESEKQLRSISASHNHPGEWSSNDWQQACELMKKADEGTIRFFLNGVVNTVFADYFNEHKNQCPTIISNLVQIANTMNDRASANRIFINAGEMEWWLGNYDKAFETLQIAIDGMESGDPNEIDDYIAAREDKAQIHVSLKEYDEAERKVENLISDIPDITETKRLDIYYNLYVSYIRRHNSLDIINKGINKIEMIVSNPNASDYAKGGAKLVLPDFKMYLQMKNQNKNKKK